MHAHHLFEVESDLAENWTDSSADTGGSDLSLQDTLDSGARLRLLCIREALAVLQPLLSHAVPLTVTEPTEDRLGFSQET